jgi:hypothetical protein
MGSVLAAGLLAVANTQAAELYYSATGPGYYSWDVASAWMIYGGGGAVGRLPTTGDTVRINATSPRAEDGHALTVTNGVFAECATFTSGYQNYPGTAWFRLDGGSLTCTANFATGQKYPGLATLESGTLYGGGSFYIGSEAGGSGTVTNNGVEVNFNAVYLGRAANSYGRLVQNGGSITGRTEVFIGDVNQGLAVLNGGTLRTAGDLRIGNSAGGDGTVTNYGAAVTANHIQVGYVSGASGRLVHNGGSLSTGGALNVGRNGGNGVFEANAPFSARIMIVGTGLVPNDPGTGTVTVAEGAAGTVDEYLRINNGDLFLRGGQIHLQNVGGNPNRTNLFVRTGVDRRGQLRGWGVFTNVSEAITMRMMNNGQIIADGEGTERDLNLNMIVVVHNDIPNGANGTIGWYAVNKGRLFFPRSMSTAFQANTPATVCCGDHYSKTTPELVNSFGVTITYSAAYVSGSRAIRGGLCAPDRSDIPSGLPAHLRPVGIWFVGSFNGSKLTPSPETFSNTTATFRYDHTKLRPTDSSLRLFRHNGSAWIQVGSCLPGGDNRISTDGALAPLASGNYNIGWFAVMAVEPNGTLISVY